MDPAQVVEIGRDLLVTTLIIALPPLIVSLLVGLTISVLQAVTSIQEQTLSFVPRLLAVGFVMLMLLGWTLQVGVQFTVRMLWYATEATR
jgi:flagellar biosynthesis protein FliQ